MSRVSLSGRGLGGSPLPHYLQIYKPKCQSFPWGAPPHLEFCALFLFSRWLFQTSSFWKENNWFQSIGSIFQAPLFKIALVYKPATWISIMRCHWKGLLPVSTSLRDVLSSELKNSKLFLTLQFAQQKRGIVLQTNFFTSSLHLCQNIFACTNCCEC